MFNDINISDNSFIMFTTWLFINLQPTETD